MARIISVVAAALIGTAVLGVIIGPVAAAGLSDAQIRRAMINESTASYPGPCACPYNTMRNGRACGRRSAYSRPGGYSPICYASDVTAQMVQAYRQAHRE
jgi:hypothetical protein